MIKHTKYLYFSFIIMLCLMLLPITTLATNIGPSIVLSYATSDNHTNGAEKNNITSACENIIKETNPNFASQSAPTDAFISYSDDSVNKAITIWFNTDKYNELPQKTKTETLQTCYVVLNSSSISSANKTRFYNFIEKNDATTAALAKSLSSDMKADYYSAYFDWFRPFTGIIGTMLGLLTICIFVLLSITIVWDIAYITLPGMQVFVNSIEEKKSVFGMLTAVSKEAKQAVKDGYDKNDQSPLSLYFGLKFKQFIVLSVCILYLVSGQIYDLLGKVMDLFIGLLH